MTACLDHSEPTCANCGVKLCGCTDQAWRGALPIDDRSEPGAWAQHMRDTECMRDHRAGTGVGL